jgi:hypothetical protein
LIFGVVVVGKEGIKGLTNPRFIGLIAVLIGAYLIYAKIAGRAPFKNRRTDDSATFWGCEKDASGVPTGRCTSYSNATEGPYNSKDLCEKALTDNPKMCGETWDYDPHSNTPTCIVTDPQVSRFASKGDCEKSLLWSCSLDEEGFASGAITKYTQDTIPQAYHTTGYYASTEAEMNQLKERACRGYWYYDTSNPSDKRCKQTTKDGLLADNSYTSEDECKRRN